MASSIYVILIVVAIAALLHLIGALWDHQVAGALKAFGEVALIGGLLLNFAALRHVGTKSVYSWASLPSWTYTVPVWVGAALLLFVGFIKLVGARRKARDKARDAKRVPEPALAS